MATTAHERAVDLALAANDGMGQLFDLLGSPDDPRGVYGLYALFLALLRELFDTPQRALLELNRMESQIVDEVTSTMAQAALLGTTIGAQMLSVYELEAGPVASTNLVGAALGVVMGIVRSQLAAARVSLLTNVFDAATVLGDAERVGILSAGPVVREAARWIAVTENGLQLQTIDVGIKSPRGLAQGDWGLQAVAAIDERTTECCLKVHGQVVPVEDGLFHLTGEPRYADDMANPPFHNFCRSGVTLVKINDATDALTRDMIDAAYAEFTARKSGDKTARRVPSSATSRRG